ncbi:hypothetical protein FHS15_000422 [Paenibacillus castaneae]|uniref:hypothetical protein n=1 Tax=Paenibacillus castaneae TaxID=474957 RepID=UPI00141ABCBD|nr:hypothetical protein [Paenibacillus castaneae]NIK75324.1 hypothetical protein [Paenibacillus castaneae]
MTAAFKSNWNDCFLINESSSSDIAVLILENDVGTGDAVHLFAKGSSESAACAIQRLYF